MQKRVQCPFCFEKFYVEVIPEDGQSQEIIYDCEICCHPIELVIEVDSESEKVYVTAQKSTGF